MFYPKIGVYKHLQNRLKENDKDRWINELTSHMNIDT